MSEQAAAGARSERFERGLDLVKRMFPNRETDRTAAAPEEIRREWGRFTLETVMGDVWTRPGLSLRNRSLVTVAALAALVRPEELASHTRGALRNGLSRRQLCEVVMQVGGYAGFPAGVEAMRVLRRVFDEIPELDPAETHDTEGPERPETMQTLDDRYERGLAVLRTIMPPVRERIPVPEEIAADWGRWIVSAAFGDLWARPGLSLRERSRVVLAVLTVLNRGPELALHLRVALHLDIPRTEIAEQIMHLALYGGFPVAVEGMRRVRLAFDEADSQT